MTKQREEVFEFVDGRRVAPTIISADHTIENEHRGRIIVESGCLTLRGSHQGGLTLESGTSAEIAGSQQGSIEVCNGAELRIHGSAQGSISVAAGGSVVIESTGRQQGSLKNHGLVVLRGRRGGSKTGDGELRVEGGTEVEPVLENGITYYRW